MIINIIIYKFTVLANAPDEIYKLLKKYNQKKYKIHFIFNDESKLINLINNNDIFIIHFNNKSIRNNKLNSKNIYKIVHYHSDPDFVCLNENNINVKLVLNQYHCTLPHYKDCKIVRNYFNYISNPIFNNQIKIGFYPSKIRVLNKYNDKGFKETCNVFNKLSKLYPDVIFDIGHSMNYVDCINRKKDCHIVIDECKTSSFHKSTIEGLMLGCNVVVNINKDIQNIHMNLYGQTLPVTNSDINNLEESLIQLINKGKKQLEEDAIKNKKIFESYWNEEIVAKEYFDIYDSLIIE